jgi:hypothetical protein
VQVLDLHTDHLGRAGSDQPAIQQGWARGGAAASTELGGGREVAAAVAGRRDCVIACCRGCTVRIRGAEPLGALRLLGLRNCTVGG